jgi:hypothetical protein
MILKALLWADFDPLTSTSSMWRDLTLAMIYQLTTVAWLMVCAAADVYLSSITVDFQISTFQLLCTRVTVGRFVSVVIVIYRTGTMSSKFFDELAAVVDCFAVYTKPIYITGNFNVEFGKSIDLYADQLRIFSAAMDSFCIRLTQLISLVEQSMPSFL